MKIILKVISCLLVIAGFLGCDSKKDTAPHQPKNIKEYCDHFVCGEVIDIVGIDRCDIKHDMDLPNPLKCNVAEAKGYAEKIFGVERKLKLACAKFVGGSAKFHPTKLERLSVEYLAESELRNATRKSTQAKAMIRFVEFLQANKSVMSKERLDAWINDISPCAPIFDDLKLQFEFEDLLDATGLDVIDLYLQIAH